MAEFFTIVFLLTGALFLIIAALGVARMPDIYTRMHATTKAATMGASLMIFAVAIFFNEIGIVTRALAIIGFLFVTAPVTAHMIGRISYFIGVPLWRGTYINELDIHSNREFDKTRQNVIKKR